MPTIEELKETHNRAENVRKSLHGIMVVAPMDAEVPAALTDETQELVLPADYLHVGLISKESGFTVAREFETEEVQALGYGSAIRIDVTSASNTIAVTALETNAVVRGLVDGLDLANVTADVNGEVSWEHPDIPPAMDYRVLVITADGSPGNWIYEAEFLPRARVTETGEVAKNQADAQQYEITFTGQPDYELGFARKSFMGGAGFDAERAGFVGNGS